ncbi:uncharacterized protein RAG0_11710 [Rhynchosporium agropyri]|uniref:Uncharacterized protein n=1 Tax=Rhynchosporium agropyri TaxID=914238 RepID=A0A1E1L5C8_9HELO|nr:uncharacterized protein RAG0_11710 [Rhynchosporium agropyri]
MSQFQLLYTKHLLLIPSPAGVKTMGSLPENRSILTERHPFPT